VREAGVRVARVESDLGAIQVLIRGLLLALVGWIGAHFLAAGRITAGQLVAFCAYAVLLQSPLRLLTTTANRLAKGSVAAGRVIRFLSLRPDPTRQVTGPDRAPVGEDLAGAAVGGDLVDTPDGGDLVDPLSRLAV